MRIIGSGGIVSNIESEILNCLEQGKVFSVKFWLLYSALQQRNFIFDPTAYAPGEGSAARMFGFFPVFLATAGPVTIEYFADPIESGDGTGITIFNRNGRSIVAPQSTFKYDPVTVTSPGTPFADDLVPSNSQGSGVSQPGSSEDFTPFIIDHTKKILFRVTNLDGNDTYIGTKFTFVEI